MVRHIFDTLWLLGKVVLLAAIVIVSGLLAVFVIVTFVRVIMYLIVGPTYG